MPGINGPIQPRPKAVVLNMRPNYRKTHFEPDHKATVLNLTALRTHREYQAMKNKASAKLQEDTLDFNSHKAHMRESIRQIVEKHELKALFTILDQYQTVQVYRDKNKQKAQMTALKQEFLVFKKQIIQKHIDEQLYFNDFSVNPYKVNTRTGYLLEILRHTTLDNVFELWKPEPEILSRKSMSDGELGRAMLWIKLAQKKFLEKL
jgi:hypothetical protein